MVTELFDVERVPGIYIEDLFVQPGYRGDGLGRALLSELAAECVRRGYSRLEWTVYRLFVPLSPLGVSALRRVVHEPAQRHDVTFAAGLVDRIVRDARAEAGALPLLAFTLSELWPRRRRRVLTDEAYEEIGGMEGSLRAQAESAITTLIESGTSATTLRGALLALISRTGGRMPVTRRTCPVTELPADQQAVIDTLVVAGLVTTDNDRTGRRVAELAHEFLLHAWPRLADLAEGDAMVRRALAIAALPANRLPHHGPVHRVVFSPEGLNSSPPAAMAPQPPASSAEH